MRHQRFWLASNSPRRREMIAWADWQTQPLSPHIDEAILDDESAEEYVERMARIKVSKPIPSADDHDILIAADTIVVNEGKILGKPVNAQDAFKILADLRGKTHQVITSLAVRKSMDAYPLMENCRSRVQMRTYSDEEIQKYIKSGDPFDKAGAYAIQDPLFRPVVNFGGCYASVMGLPLCHMERALRKLDGYIPTDWASHCQRNLNYACPITDRVMMGENIG